MTLGPISTADKNLFILYFSLLYVIMLISFSVIFKYACIFTNFRIHNFLKVTTLMALNLLSSKKCPIKEISDIRNNLMISCYH